MKAIINRKRYDTDTATEVACWGNGHSPSDFYYMAETLYKTKSGAWFIHGRGGAMTGYCENVGNSLTGGERIVPMTADEALDWLEQHNRTDEIAAHFGDCVTDA